MKEINRRQFIAGAAVLLLFPEALRDVANGVPSVAGVTFVQAAVIEAVLTFFLMLVILSVARGSKEQGLMAGIAIGATVGLEAMFAGPVCNASMNPARSIGPAIVAGNLSNLWLFIAAPLIGAALAVPAWKACKINPQPAEAT